MENPSNEHERIARIEAEKVEYKKIVRKTLQDVFGDVLDSAELEKRLSCIGNVVFVTAEQMDEIAKSNPKDAGASGLIRYEVGETEVRRIPVVMTTPSRAETLHTLLHESVHLMTPPSVPVFDPMREDDEQYFSDYVGAYRFNRLKSDKTLDHRSLLETTQRHNEHFMFWEAVTDWIAADDKIFNDEELKEIENSGYFERHMINYLWAQCPDDQGLFRSLRESYVQDSEDQLRWFLQKQTGTQDDQMFDQLLSIMGRKKKDSTQVEDWKTVVNKYFKTTE